MFGLQPTHLILIFVVALLIFGPQRLPELAKSFGKTIGEFKRASSDLTEPVRSIEKTTEKDSSTV
ncbi:MAG: twin-arginine translocase TatA/TatE family subunit [Chloroflexi bacterium]|nr:twin-arginine translocase TatA/TatE family subunit [Chloroflexota bacterium]